MVSVDVCYRRRSKLNVLIAFFYRWLPIIFGCHCRSDRSFYWKGKQFPICARCTGELFGILSAIITSLFYMYSVKTSMILLIPLIVDGSIQYCSTYESNNVLRFCTGYLFGIGLYTLAARSTVFTFHCGYMLGQCWK